MSNDSAQWAGGVEPVAIHCRACDNDMLSPVILSLPLSVQMCHNCGVIGEFYVVDNRRVIPCVG